MKKAITQIERVTALINHKDILNLLFMRAKPKYCYYILNLYRIASQRIVSRLLNYTKLCDKHRDAITSSERKERELLKEIEQVRKQIDEGEKRVRELTLVIQSELSTKLNAVVKVSL